MKYMVMECHLSYAIVLAEDGKFLKVANLHYQVGQTVSDVVEMHAPEQPVPKKSVLRWWYSLPAIAACIILMVTSMFPSAQVPYGSVYMTINPAVRIDVDQNDRVVGIEGTNSDGKDLILGYRYKKKDLTLVMDELTDRAIDMGFLHEGGQITLTLDAEDGEWIASHKDTLSDNLNQHLTGKIRVIITVTDVNSQSHEVIIPIVPKENFHTEPDPAMTGKDPVQTEQMIPSKTLEPPAPPTVSYKESDYGDAGHTSESGGITDYDADVGHTTSFQPLMEEPMLGSDSDSDYAESDEDSGSSYTENKNEEQEEDDLKENMEYSDYGRDRVSSEDSGDGDEDDSDEDDNDENDNDENDNDEDDSEYSGEDEDNE